MAIYKEDIVNIDLENAEISRSFVKHTIGEGDIYANRFGVKVLRNGEPVNMTGVTCSGYFIRSDGGTVYLTGAVEGNTAYVSLAQACYAVEGQFALAIKLTGGGITGTMRIVDGVVSNTTTGTVVDPGNILPSIEDLIEEIEEAIASIPPDYSETVEELNYIEEKAYTTDWVEREGVVEGRLINDGTVTSDSSFKTTGFIPVNAGDVYELHNPGSGTYSLYRCTYNASKQFIAYAFINAEAKIRDYTIPSGVSYVRFSVSNTVYNNGFAFRWKVDKFDAVDAATVGLDVINETIRCIDYAKRFGFTQGLLSTSNGTVDTTDATMATIYDYIPVKTCDKLIIKVNDVTDFSLWRALYDKNKNFVSGDYIPVTGNIRAYDVLPGIAYVKYCVSRNIVNKGVSIYIDNDVTNGEFHLMSLPVKAEMHAYTGEQLPLDLKNQAKWVKLLNLSDPGPSGKTQQGMAIYNSILFQFCADDLVQLFDIQNGGAFIGQYTLSCGHGNSACFSNEFYNASDEFPLCYVSDLDGYVYCFRLTRTSATLIKTLYFYETGYGYDPQFALDTANNICYTVANKVNGETMQTAIVTKYDMTSMTQNPDTSYTPEQLDQYEVSIPGVYPVLQGVKYLNDHLFLASGAYGDEYDAFITVIDLTSKSVSSRIADIPSAVAKKEMEDIAFMPSPFCDKYDIIVHFRQNGYYKVSL